MKMNFKSNNSKKMIVGLVMMLVLNCGDTRAQPQQGLMNRP